jgi:1-acyl-sn-glycerol-3-phosphate acyltransferase
MRKKIYPIFSFLVFVALYIHTAFVLVLIAPFAYLSQRFMVKYILLFWARSVFWIMGKRLKIVGLENLDRQKRYIILANHASLFDIMAIMAIYPDVSWFGHYRLLKIPVFSQILKMINYIPLRQKSIGNTKKMLNEIIEKSKDHSVAIFPEGTRTLNGNVQDFYKGFIYIIKASDADVLPVTLKGFYKLKPKNRSYIDFSVKLSVIINPVVKNAELKSKTDQEIVSYLKSNIELNLANDNIN